MGAREVRHHDDGRNDPDNPIALMTDEEERRAELSATAKNVAAILVQHDRRLTLLETEFRIGLSFLRWASAAGLTLLAALLASNWIPRP